IVSKANFLMLDEPTNHLDMHSCDLLIESLRKYEGTIILVSHDRYFVAKTANKIWEIVDHQIKEFKGGYDQWSNWKERRQKNETEAKKAEEKEQGGRKKQTETKATAAADRANNNTKSSPVQQSSSPVAKETKKELQKQQ